MNGQVINSILSDFPPISLEEMGGVRLMNRIDTKYTIHRDHLRLLLQNLHEDYFIQEINGNRLSPYQTIYLDTPELDMYMVHQNGRRTREKIRMRTYADTRQVFLEIKDKDNRGRTSKTRIPLPSVQMYKEEEATRFIGLHTCYHPDRLAPQIENHFNRITLVNRKKTERLTIDIDLGFRNLSTNITSELPEVAIIELKQDGHIPSQAKRCLSELHIHPVSISKYCLGIILTHPDIKHNRFKKKLIQLNKITNDIYRYTF